MENILEKLKRTFFHLVFIFIFFTPADGKIDLVKVDKSAREMYLMEGTKVIRVYKISLGKNPIGPKERSGDKKTPEGFYILDYKNSKSIYYKSIHISYPNKSDRANASEKGWDPGGDITIHGQLGDVFSEMDWTEGCIGVSNEDIDEIWEMLDIPVPIIIEP